MRRISLAVALIGAVAAAGCGGGSKPSSSGAKGTAGINFSVTVNNQGPGTVADSSTPANTCAADSTCTWTYSAGTTVVLTATKAGSNYFNGWFGDCGGTDTCSLSGNADKYVVAFFSASPQSHPNFNDPALHGSASLNCASCHGVNGQGVGIAPSCTGCHAPVAAKKGLQIAITSAGIAGQVATVRFTVKDGSGAAIDITKAYAGSSATGTIIPVVMDGTLRIAVARIDKATDGQVLPYAVLTPAVGTSAWSPGTVTLPKVGVAPGTSGAVVQNAVGDYTWTSPNLAKIDATKFSSTHTVWFQATRQENAASAFDPKGFTAVNLEFNFLPDSGSVLSGPAREIVTTAACNKCHGGFSAEPAADGKSWASFHGGARIDGKFCDICHNPGRTSNPAADAMVFIHRIHGAEQVELPTALQFHGIAVTYPQDVRNCKECHGGAAQGDQFKTRPSRAACGSCHFGVDFASGTGHNPNGLYGEPANLVQTDDSQCASCHLPAYIEGAHVAVAPVDPNNCFTLNNAAGCNGNTNAGFLASAGAVPTDAVKITYEIGTVSAFVDAGGVRRPQMTFRFLKDGAPAPIDYCSKASGVTADATKELFDNFVGSPSVYWVFAAPQDGITAPADFNASASAYVKAVCQQGKTSMGGTTAATITGPDANQFYTVTLTATTIPATAQMLTGGVGYTYALGSTQPLTQTNLSAYPTTDVSVTAGSVNGVTCTSAAPCSVKTGGLVVPAPNVTKVATGYTGRRAIVATDRCNACHTQLGAAPTFHAGQRNDGPTCSWCHTPNRTSSGWSANASTFIHGIHGSGKRTVGFTWHAACPTGSTFTQTTGSNGGTCVDAGGATVTPSPWYQNVEYPNGAYTCTQCHVDGSFDFSAAANGAAVPNLLWSTVGTGSYTAAISTSPYVTLGTAYGSGYSVSSSGVPTAAAATTLVNSPITAACFSCHDSAAAKNHMIGNGGHIYEPRSTAMANGTNTEECLGCHGPGKFASIADMHQ
jgi:OmcA/MtrC family decaheme c-type cytochrome